MTHENFNNLVDSLEKIRINTLKTKNAKYAPENDALHNFHAGAEIMGVTVPECIWGYMTKHLVALRDKILRNDWEDKDDALEKIQVGSKEWRALGIRRHFRRRGGNYLHQHYAFI